MERRDFLNALVSFVAGLIMKRSIYSESGRKRIDAVVKRIEQQRIPTGSGATAREPDFAQVLLGKTAALISKGSSGTINLYFGGPKGSEDWASFGSQTVSAYNRFADAASGKWVLIIYTIGGWEILQSEC